MKNFMRSYHVIFTSIFFMLGLLALADVQAAAQESSSIQNPASVFVGDSTSFTSASSENIYSLSQAVSGNSLPAMSNKNRAHISNDQSYTSFLKDGFILRSFNPGTDNYLPAVFETSNDSGNNNPVRDSKPFADSSETSGPDAGSGSLMVFAGLCMIGFIVGRRANVQ